MDKKPTTPALSVKNVSVTIDNHAIVDEISFSVPVGSITALIGPNGAGKSILLKSLLGLIPKTTGSVEFFGVNHERYREVAPYISYIPQYLAFDRDFPLTIRGLFSLKSPQPLGMTDIEENRMAELLRLVNMGEHAHKKLSVLSGGELQRILIAYSLMDHPKLLILDEPSAGIDVSGQETIYELLRRIQADERLTMILVSHELDVVMQYADQVLCLNKKLLCAGVPHEVLSNELLEKMYGAPVKHVDHSHPSKH